MIKIADEKNSEKKLNEDYQYLYIQYLMTMAISNCVKVI